jgi:hypothetical protein
MVDHEGRNVMSALIRVDADERRELLTQLANQRDLLRMSAYGLGHEHVTATPTVSDISLAGVIKSAARLEQRWIAGALYPASPSEPSDCAPASPRGTRFGLESGETLADVIGLYAAVAEQTQAAVDSVADLGQPVPYPPRTSTFLAGNRAWSVRAALLQVIEVTAGHVHAADIVRNLLEGSLPGAGSTSMSSRLASRTP